jgi:hypothetical protein
LASKTLNSKPYFFAAAWIPLSRVSQYGLLMHSARYAMRYFFVGFAPVLSKASTFNVAG